jgi:hypothetical protein
MESSLRNVIYKPLIVFILSVSTSRVTSPQNLTQALCREGYSSHSQMFDFKPFNVASSNVIDCFMREDITGLDWY